jgi:hypothetical protein
LARKLRREITGASRYESLRMIAETSQEYRDSTHVATSATWMRYALM